MCGLCRLLLIGLGFEPFEKGYSHAADRSLLPEAREDRGVELPKGVAHRVISPTAVFAAVPPNPRSCLASEDFQFRASRPSGFKAPIPTLLA